MKALVLAALLLFGSVSMGEAQPPTGGAGTQSALPMYSLTVSKSGAGSGTITGAGPINCGTTCTANYVSGVTTRLTATAAGGSTFTGWSGACSGTGMCNVTMSTSKNVTATFAAAAAFTRYLTNNGNISGNCTSSTAGTNGPCRADYGLGTYAAPDEKFGMIDGTYQGVNNMLNLSDNAPGKNGTSGHPIIVQAVNPGQVFIDGQYAREPLVFSGHNYWTVQDIDFGNGFDAVGSVTNSTNITIQRSCFSNTAAATNSTVLGTWQSQNVLMEDICIFGTGRNMFVTYDDGSFSGAPPNKNNTFRRFWSRNEGWTSDGQCNFYNMQPEYYEYGDVGHDGLAVVSGDELYENVILVYGMGIQTYNMANCTNPPTSGSPEGYPGFSRRWTSAQVRRYGMISYGYNTAQQTCCPEQWREGGASQASSAGTFRTNMVDLFVDARWNTSTGMPAVGLGCSPAGANCSTNTVDRITALRNTVNPTSTNMGTNYGSATNTNECTTPGACPDFYTGGTGPFGSRNCFEYVSGTLTSTGLWPWRMDDRIKAALARAAAAGTGGTALAGGSGTGYASSTVTSEIVSRYGSVPGTCLRAGLFRIDPIMIVGPLFIFLAGAAFALRRKYAGLRRRY